MEIRAVEFDHISQLPLNVHRKARLIISDVVFHCGLNKNG